MLLDAELPTPWKGHPRCRRRGDAKGQLRVRPEDGANARRNLDRVKGTDVQEAGLDLERQLSDGGVLEGARAVDGSHDRYDEG